MPLAPTPAKPVAKPSQPPKVAAAPKPPVARPTQPKPAPEPTPAAAPKRDAKKAGLDALREYESAYEARDIGRLARVWLINRNQRNSLKHFFNDVDSISMDVKIVDVYTENESVYIDFVQSFTSEGRARLKRKPANMTATVIPRGNGKWVISSILPSS